MTQQEWIKIYSKWPKGMKLRFVSFIDNYRKTKPNRRMNSFSNEVATPEFIDVCKRFIALEEIERNRLYTL